jgi:hypothetical protein
MTSWVNLILDLVLIGFVAAGLVQASRLLHQLAGLRQGRLEMERFVQDFSAAILRAENGVKDLRQAARRSGDDLEKLVEKAGLIKDELQFIIGSADQIANRLSGNASTAVRPAAREGERPAATDNAVSSSPEVVTSMAARKPAPTATPSFASSAPTSRAEKELMQALEKLG